MRGRRGSVTIHREGIRAKERAMTSDTRTEPGDLIVIEGRSVGTGSAPSDAITNE